MVLKKNKLKKKSSRLQQIILGIGIMVLLVSFILYGLEVFYPTPEWSDFCREEMRPMPVYSKFGTPLDTQINCESKQGKWHPRDYPCPVGVSEKEVECPEGYCDYNFYCQKDHESASELYSMYTLLVLSIIGVSILIGGLFVQVQVISNSIMAGGVIIILRGVIGAWNFLSKYLQWALLGVLLALLIWVAYKKFR